MPRRKGYGIPPTKRIKIENEIENNENEPNAVMVENTTVIAMQKPPSQNENYVPESSTSGVVDGLANVTHPPNGTKYLHKKFKKMAAILSDDSVSNVAVSVEKSVSPPVRSVAIEKAPPAAKPDDISPARTVAMAAAAVTSSPHPIPVVVSTSPQPTLPQSDHRPSAIVLSSLPLSGGGGDYLSHLIAAHPTSTAPAARCTRDQSSLTTTTTPPTVENDAFKATAALNVYCISRPRSPVVAAAAVSSPFLPPTETTPPPPLLDTDGVSVPAAVLSNNRHTCTYCGLVCNKPSVLQKHLRAHTNERPFPCQLCGFAFKTRSNLYKHCRSRSHFLKVEEAGGKGVFSFAEEECGGSVSGGGGGGGADTDENEPSRETIVEMAAHAMPDDGGGGGGRSDQPKKSIYKPKFHKAAIYMNSDQPVPQPPQISPLAVTTGAVVGLNKFGLQLKIAPTPQNTINGGGSGGNSGTRSTPSTPSPFTSCSSPSPEFLQRHISKLISENQAIVETTDPFWSKKFYQRSNGTRESAASNLAAAVETKKRPATTAVTALAAASVSMESHQQATDERLPTVESKLAFALMQPKAAKCVADAAAVGETGISCSRRVEDSQQPLNLTTHKEALKTTRMVVDQPMANVCAEDTKPLALEVHQKLVQIKSEPKKTEMQQTLSPVTNAVVSNDSSSSNGNSGKFVRPTSLPLKPGTFVPKKLLPGAVSALPLISPETPRPNKSYGQLYIGGNAYTYLGLKCSTRNTFCTLHKSQPTYVPLSPEHNKVSMYSNWKVRTEVGPYLPATKAMSCYDSRHRYSPYTVVHGKMKDAVTHSSYWFNKTKTRIENETKSNAAEENKENFTKVNEKLETKDDSALKMRIGQMVSSDDGPYVRGRGRGKYVCLECGIRCKKPSMLKKHLRTHTDMRPYTCRHCAFSFKTKGNLTKHMKSKAHYKKCVELGISPVATIAADDCIVDEEEQQTEDGQDLDETEEEDDEEEDDDEDENEDDFGDDDPKCQLEREVAKSLLSLSKMSHQTVSEQYANAGLVPLNARPNTYPYNFSAVSQLSSKPHTPTLTFISEQKERETVSKNTGLARELQPSGGGVAVENHVAKQPTKCESQTAGGRYYFGSSSVDKETATTTSVADATCDLRESVVKDPVTVTLVFPIDLSSKNATDKKPSRNATISSADAVCYAATTNNISEILTPVSEPVLMASICSTTDRLPPPPASACNVTDIAEGSVMLQTYLKERAVQDLKMKQQYQSPPQHIKVDQREFDLKYNAYNEAFHIGATAPPPEKLLVDGATGTTVAAAATTVITRTTPSPKRKGHFASSYDQEVVEKNYAKSDADAKENYALANTNTGTNDPSKRLKAEFMPYNGSLPKYTSILEDGRSKCGMCNKVFTKPSQLRLHVNIHYFEQQYRCQPCSQSFRTKGLFHKHLGTNSHLTKVSMNTTSAGQSSLNNPRPFKCDDCSIGFRIHGHLAKHLRSKMHIMKLECLGKLPFGTYAEMERCGVNMNDINTSDCENSLQSLKKIAKDIESLGVMYVNNANENV